MSDADKLAMDTKDAATNRMYHTMHEDLLTYRGRPGVCKALVNDELGGTKGVQLKKLISKSEKMVVRILYADDTDVFVCEPWHDAQYMLQLGDISFLEHVQSAIAALFDKMWRPLAGREREMMGHMFSELLGANTAWQAQVAVCKQMISDEKCEHAARILGS